jgi:hypothetical protein
MKVDFSNNWELNGALRRRQLQNHWGAGGRAAGGLNERTSLQGDALTKGGSEWIEGIFFGRRYGLDF